MKKKLLPIMIGVFVLGGAFFAYTTFLKPSAPSEPPAVAQARLKKETAAEKKERLKEPIDGPVVQVAEPFTVNLADRAGVFYTKFAVALKFDEETPVILPAHGAKDPPVIEELPEIRDAIITVVSGKTSAELATEDGWKHAKEEIKALVNKQAPHSVVLEVFVTDRAVQAG